MVIKAPQHLVFSNEESNLKKEIQKTVFKFTEYELSEWEISVSSRDDMAWSIVLAYLFSTNYRIKDDLSSRLKTLTGTDGSLLLVQKAIENFNPFRNRSSIFFCETMKQVVNDFKINLNWDNLKSPTEKLSIASCSLKCPVLLIPVDFKNHDKYKIFGEHFKNLEDMITLKCSNFIDDRNKKITVYNFMIERSQGFKMKRAALLYFLKQVKTSRKEINTLMSIESKNNQLLISLLKIRCYNIIRKLYKSPYIVSKISEAGYEMNPLSKDCEGLSALYHALQDLDTMYMLYYFSVNFSVSEASYRNPDEYILSNLRNVEETLLYDKNILERKDKNDDINDSKKYFDELIKFNKFLIEINNKFVDIKKELNSYKSQDVDVFKAKKRRDIIVTLLETYKNFSSVGEENITSFSLDEYVLNKNYYNLIDMATGLIFFDNIIFLKEKLTLENEKLFSEMESSFFLSMTYIEIFKIVEKEKDATCNYICLNLPRSYFSSTFSSSQLITLFHNFSLLRRLDNFNKIEEFLNVLQNTLINEDKIVKGIPESECFSILHPYPEFKDIIQKRRLRYHITTALSVKVINVQSVLVIEHALQVIGEYLTVTKDNCFLKKILPLSLPKSISHMLLQVRNELTHLKGHTFPFKFVCEKNLSLFRNIQREIMEIEKKFQIVYHILDLKFALCCLEGAKEQIERARALQSTETFTHFGQAEIKNIINLCFSRFFKKQKYSLLNFIQLMLFRLKDELQNETYSHILDILSLLESLCKLGEQCNVICDGTYSTFTKLKECDEEITKTNDFKKEINTFIENLENKTFLTFTFFNWQPLKSDSKKPFINFKNIEHFLKVLKGHYFLSDDEKNQIRQEISPKIREEILKDDLMIQKLTNFNDGKFSYNIDEQPDFKISYFSKNKMKKFKDLYQNKDLSAFRMLKEPNPIQELEEIFSQNYTEKKKYDRLCEFFNFTEETRRKLRKIVAGQRQKNPGNDLKNTLNRIQLLKNIIIEENENVYILWTKVKSENFKQQLLSKIIFHYMKNHHYQVAVDMLLFDCMIIFKNHCKTDFWIKSSKLYSGINLRNVISHGSPLLEFLCELLDPEDLASEKIKKILSLTEAEDTVKAILELYETLNCDFTLLNSTINSEEKDEHSCLRKRILKCNRWKDYVRLLPL